MKRTATSVIVDQAAYRGDTDLGRILIGVVIGVILVVWLLVSCVQMIF